ncbi:MaoC family dehydratase N-terminal domain-containing protein [Hoeflea sp. YIM 152468]|uniref:FAS1-like dehydratase domain-containing protein n=1 Tax=Hoeflea sp. YIM 152468 TaxID=3031759 RepID=UPI0023DB9F09|nr:MaoC family dehydratase N-terminal domain-containing protein [Hoeflea sp. YIM 152468]MDF1608946.1 MaoC family dehydratase N-terminal domain-containing protein [Hoeflea sp. YIM 152468]
MDTDIEHLRTWIGRTQSECELLTASLARRFNATFDRTSGTQPGDRAALMIHFCLAQPIAATAELGPDGHPARGGFLPPIPLPRRMWAGGALTFYSDIRIGETVSRLSTIKDVVLKEGRSGPLWFVTVEHELTSDDRAVLTERQDIVYRGATPPHKPAANRAQPAAPRGSFCREITPSSAQLFRYSALTFNSHRIHYDAPYAGEAEGYPGLVVHGPMQATLLCQAAADLKGATPKSFRFRSLSPIFDTADFTVNASEGDGGLKLWTASANGPVAMEAFATW